MGCNNYRHYKIKLKTTNYTLLIKQNRPWRRIGAQPSLPASRTTCATGRIKTFFSPTLYHYV